jgi:hypothetical protein
MVCGVLCGVCGVLCGVYGVWCMCVLPVLVVEVVAPPGRGRPPRRRVWACNTAGNQNTNFVPGTPGVDTST